MPPRGRFSLRMQHATLERMKIFAFIVSWTCVYLSLLVPTVTLLDGALDVIEHRTGEIVFKSGSSFLLHCAVLAAAQAVIAFGVAGLATKFVKSRNDSLREFTNRR